MGQPRPQIGPVGRFDICDVFYTSKAGTALGALQKTEDIYVSRLSRQPYSANW